MLIKGQVVAKQQAAALRHPQQRQQLRQARDVFPVDLHKGESVRLPLVNGGVGRLDERALAGAASAPQQYIVGRQAGGEPLGVVEQNVADPVDPAQQRDLDPIDLVNRRQPTTVGVPTLTFGVECIERSL